MRTKTLVLAAAALAAGLATSVAQSNVYSVNVVGYINLTLTNGFQMVANQLDADLTGSNNTVNTTFSTNLPVGSTVYAFSGGAFLPSASYTKAGWGGNTNAVNAALTPGAGVFVSVPSSKTITLVGNVLQGSLSNAFSAGFNMVASAVPQAGLAQTDLGLVPQTGSTVYRYNPTNQAYLPSYSFTKAGWSTQPTVNVGEAFWLSSPGAGAWTRVFTVGP